MVRRWRQILRAVAGMAVLLSGSAAYPDAPKAPEETLPYADIPKCLPLEEWLDELSGRHVQIIGDGMDSSTDPPRLVVIENVVGILTFWYLSEPEEPGAPPQRACRLGLHLSLGDPIPGEKWASDFRSALVRKLLKRERKR